MLCSEPLKTPYLPFVPQLEVLEWCSAANLLLQCNGAGAHAADASWEQVLLTGIPLTVGMFTVVGCDVTALGVSWRQPWTPRYLFVAGTAWPKEQAPVKELGGGAQVGFSLTSIRINCSAER